MDRALSGKRRDNASSRQRSPGMPQGVLRRARRIDPCPIERAKVVALLMARHVHIGIRGIVVSRSDTRKSRREVGGKEQTLEACAAWSGCRDPRAFLIRGKNRVDDCRMAGCEDAPGFVD